MRPTTQVGGIGSLRAQRWPFPAALLSVARSAVCSELTANPEITSLIPAWSHTFLQIDHEIISNRPFPSADSIYTEHID